MIKGSQIPAADRIAKRLRAVAEDLQKIDFELRTAGLFPALYEASCSVQDARTALIGAAGLLDSAARSAYAAARRGELPKEKQ